MRHITKTMDPTDAAPDDPVFDRGDVAQMAADRSSAVSALPKARDFEPTIPERSRPPFRFDLARHSEMSEIISESWARSNRYTRARSSESASEKPELSQSRRADDT
jgi:hypothetical protein